MPVWQWVVDIAAVVLLAALLYGLYLVVRRRLLSREGGTFELSVRLFTEHPGRGWALGLGRYRGNQLEWFRIFMPGWRPRLAWDRTTLTYQGRREPTEQERTALFAGQIIVTCDTPDGTKELAMSEASLTGWLSWLEAGPPGQRVGMRG